MDDGAGGGGGGGGGGGEGGVDDMGIDAGLQQTDPELYMVPILPRLPSFDQPLLNVGVLTGLARVVGSGQAAGRNRGRGTPRRRR